MRYCFVKNDEMPGSTLCLCTARTFSWGMAATALLTLVLFAAGRTANTALICGFAGGWVISVVAHSLLIDWLGLRER